MPMAEIKLKIGRKERSVEFKSAILSVINDSNRPLTIEAIRNIVSSKMGRSVSWNTIKKYIEQLVEDNTVNKTELPHSRFPDKKKGLVVYTKKL